MSSKNISVREDVYRTLKREKREDESFSDAIDRLLAAEEDGHPLFDLVGALDEDAADEVRERAAEFRRDVDDGMGTDA